MAKLTPYIFSEDSRAQAAFYTQALGGEILSVMTHGQFPGVAEEMKDKVMHMSLVVAGGNALFMTDAFEPFSRGPGMSLSLEFETEAGAREAFDKLAEGGNVKYPLEQQPWGAIYGEVKDKYGIMWMIVKQN